MCRLFKWCRNLPPGHSKAGVLAVQMVLETTSQALWGRCASCLRCVKTYLPGTVRQGYRLFKGCQNLPPGHCGAGVQAA